LHRTWPKSALLAARRRDARGSVFITAMAPAPPGCSRSALPFLAELDGPVPDRPVFLYQAAEDPRRTNSEGKKFFET